MFQDKLDTLQERALSVVDLRGFKSLNGMANRVATVAGHRLINEYRSSHRLKSL